MKIILISIHAPPRGATTARRGFPGGSPISIHAPPRGATIPNCATRTFAEYFNSRPSARGDFALGTFFPRAIQFQFTPLREGRLRVRRTADSSDAISIHAPPRGATLRFAPRIIQALISIHAPPRGATSAPRSHATPPTNFNSRPSARGDERGHPPAEEAQHFNSRPSARGDGTVSKSALCDIRFQFTPLREGRLPRMLSEGEAGENFNSRPSARGDQT